MRFPLAFLLLASVAGCIHDVPAGRSGEAEPSSPCGPQEAVATGCYFTEFHWASEAVLGDLGLEIEIQPQTTARCLARLGFAGVRLDWGPTDALLLLPGQGGFEWWSSAYHASAHAHVGDVLDTRPLTSEEDDWVRMHGQRVWDLGNGKLSIIGAARGLRAPAADNPFTRTNSTVVLLSCDAPVRFVKLAYARHFLFFDEQSMERGAGAHASGQTVTFQDRVALESPSSDTLVVMAGGDTGNAKVTTPEGTEDWSVGDAPKMRRGGVGAYTVELSIVQGPRPFWAAVFPLEPLRSLQDLE